MAPLSARAKTPKLRILMRVLLWHALAASALLGAGGAAWHEGPSLRACAHEVTGARSCPAPASVLSAKVVADLPPLPPGGAVLHRVVVHNRLKSDRLAVVNYLDEDGREHARYVVPPNCAKWFPAREGTAWRARPAPPQSTLPRLTCGGERDGGPSSADAVISDFPTVGHDLVTEFFVGPRGVTLDAVDCSALLLGPAGGALPTTPPVQPQPPPASATEDPTLSDDVLSLELGEFSSCSPRRGPHTTSARSRGERAAATVHRDEFAHMPPACSSEFRPGANEELAALDLRVDVVDVRRGQKASPPPLDAKVSRRRASLSLSCRTVVGSNPVVAHDGLVVSVQTDATDLLRPRAILAEFVRTERCQGCNYPLLPNGTGAQEGEDMRQQQQRLPIVHCPRCAGKGLVKMQAEHGLAPLVDGDHDHGDPKSVGSGGGGGGGGEGGRRHGSTHPIGLQTATATCPLCEGVGTVLLGRVGASPHTECPLCANRRYLTLLRSHSVVLPAGVESDWSRTAHGEGGVAPARLPGPLVVKLETALSDGLYDTAREGGLERGGNADEDGDSTVGDGGRGGGVPLPPLSRVHGAALVNVTRAGLPAFFGRLLSFDPDAFPAGSTDNTTNTTPPEEAGGKRRRPRSRSAKGAEVLLHTVPAEASFAPTHDGPHLVMRVTMSLEDAVSGKPLSVVAPRDRVVVLEPARRPLFPGDVFVVPGLGLPLHLPGLCTWTAPCGPHPRRHPRGDGRKAGEEDPTVRVECDWPEILARECAGGDARLASAWGAAYAQYATCASGTALPGPAEMEAELAVRADAAEQQQPARAAGDDAAGGGGGDDGPPPSSSITRTHVVCHPLPDSSVRNFPHGHLYVVVDVDTSASFAMMETAIDVGRGTDSAAGSHPPPPPPPSPHVIIQATYKQMLVQRKADERRARVVLAADGGMAGGENDVVLVTAAGRWEGEGDEGKEEEGEGEGSRGLLEGGAMQRRSCPTSHAIQTYLGVLATPVAHAYRRRPLQGRRRGHRRAVAALEIDGGGARHGPGHLVQGA
jgi:hypothetical protein